MEESVSIASITQQALIVSVARKGFTDLKISVNSILIHAKNAHVKEFGDQQANATTKNSKESNPATVFANKDLPDQSVKSVLVAFKVFLIASHVLAVWRELLTEYAMDTVLARRMYRAPDATNAKVGILHYKRTTRKVA